MLKFLIFIEKISISYCFIYVSFNVVYSICSFYSFDLFSNKTIYFIFNILGMVAPLVWFLVSYALKVLTKKKNKYVILLKNSYIKQFY